MVHLSKIFAIGFLFWGTAFPSRVAEAGVSPRGFEALRERYGVTVFDTIPNINERLKVIKIAVLDNGFGDPSTLYKDLPSSIFKLVDIYPAEFIKAHDLGDPENQNPLDRADAHGRQMAMLAWAMTGLKKEAAPQFLLLNANGFTNFRRAIQTAINEKVDIILNSQNWEYGGNFDGRGHVNREVSRATRAGILWVNAAGNHAGKVHNAPVLLDDSKYVKLGPENKGVRLKCRLDRAGVKITLAWNSFNESEKTGTEKDLDLFLLDADGNVVAKSELNQIESKPGVTLAEGQSYLAREIIDIELDRTEKDKPYRLKVLAKNGNFTGADRLRITITNKKPPAFDAEERKAVDGVELLDFQPSHEIMIPADHPEVLAVGDLTTATSRGPTMDGRAKPDLVLRYSEAEFTDGDGFAGTSNAAAYFAGILAMIKAYQPNLTREMIMAQVKPEFLSKLRRPGENSGIRNFEHFLPDGKTETNEWKAFFETYGRLAASVEEIVGDGSGKKAILLVGKYEAGSHVIAINTSPLLLGKYFKHFPDPRQNPNHYQVYVAEVVENGKLGLWAYVRDKANAGAKEQPWETLLKDRPDLFVELILAKPVQKPQDDKKFPLWEMPPISAWSMPLKTKK